MRRQKAAHASAFGLRPWCTWIAETWNCLLSRCSSTTESTPPDNATATRLALGGFLELAIAHQTLDELLGLLLLQLLERFDQRLAQRLRGRLRVAVGAADGFRDDLVDQAEGLQAAGGDAERVRRVGRHVGAAPQDRGAALGRDHGIG